MVRFADTKSWWQHAMHIRAARISVSMLAGSRWKANVARCVSKKLTRRLSVVIIMFTCRFYLSSSHRQCQLPRTRAHWPDDELNEIGRPDNDGIKYGRNDVSEFSCNVLSVMLTARFGHAYVQVDDSSTAAVGQGSPKH